MSKLESDIGKLDPAMKAGAAAEKKLRWYSSKEAPFQVAGFGWFKKEGLYRRLPSTPKHPIREAVAQLAGHSAGGQIRFRTDSSLLSLQVELLNHETMAHMPSTGHSGFDCYIGEPGKQVYCNTTKFYSTTGEYEIVLFDFSKLEKATRHLALFFPLYNGVKEVRIGLEPEAQVLPPAPFASDRPVVIYGTSVTQGGCASRPGMAYSNILSRRMNLEFINLGFSGNGKGEPELAQLICEIPNPLCLVLDYEANCNEEGLLEKTFPEFIRILRTAHPKVPILAQSRCPTALELFDASVRERRLKRMRFQRDTIEQLRRQCDDLLFFEDGSEFLGKDFHETTVDGVHPTDLGFLRMADAIQPKLAAVLAGVR